MTKVVIGVCTFRRPESLGRLLRSLAALRTGASVTVLVADNDAEKREGAAVCETVAAEGFPFPLRTIVVPERGLAAVRNAVVDAAFDFNADYLAFLDDDQSVVSGWMDAMISAAERYEADVVAGPNQPAFDVPAQPWHHACKVYARNDFADGRVEQIYGICNALVRPRLADVVERPWFASDYAFTGGEDNHFFKRAKAAGATFAFDSKAVAFEHFPPARMTESWVLQRAYREGCTEMLIARKMGIGVARKAKFWLRLPFAIASAFGRTIVFAWSKERQMNGRCDLSRQWGRLAGMQGRAVEEYRHPVA